MANNQIALLAQAPQFDTPLESQSKALQLRALMNQVQQQDMTMDAARRARADDEAVRRAYADNPTDSAARLQVLARTAPKAYQAERKAMQEEQVNEANIGAKKASTRKDQVDAAHKALDIAGQAFGHVRQNPTLDNALAAIDYLGTQSDLYKPEQLEAWRAQVRANPGQIKDMADLAFRSVLSAKDQLPKTETRNLGGTTDTLSIDPVTGQTKVLNSVKNTQSPDSVATQAGEDRRNKATIAKDLTVAGMNPDGTPMADVETMANGIASGKLAPINGFALAKPRGQAIMARVMEINPNYDAGDYAAKNAALKGFSTGKEGTALRSFNVATDHLETLGAMADALNNGNLQLLNKAGNIWNQQTGAAAPTNFNAVKEIVGKEVVKAIVAGGGGVEERREMSQLLDAANSPAQLKGVITHFKELMQAQRDGLMDQYQRTTGRADGKTVFAPSRKVANPMANPAARPTLDEIFK